MAEDKKGFILYADLISVVEKLILKDRENKTNYSGELFFHILKYVNDENPIAVDFIVEMAFEPIKLQLKRDLEKYIKTKEGFSKAGKASAEARRIKKLNEKQREATTLNDVENVATFSTVSVNDTVNVTVNDNVTDKDINKKENKQKVFNFRKELINLGAKEDLVTDWLKDRKSVV